MRLICPINQSDAFNLPINQSDAFNLPN
jgi:hypothetical protein